MASNNKQRQRRELQNKRKRCTKIRINQLKTGGGPADYIPPDEVLHRITALLGGTATGFTAELGGDSQIVQAENGGGDATVSPIVEADCVIGDENNNIIVEIYDFRRENTPTQSI